MNQRLTWHAADKGKGTGELSETLNWIGIGEEMIANESFSTLFNMQWGRAGIREWIDQNLVENKQWQKQKTKNM